MWKVYLIKSFNRNWYYIGSTNRLKERLSEHNLGQVKSTKPYRPFILVYIKDFYCESEARKYEKKVKDCRKEKEKLINMLKK